VKVSLYAGTKHTFATDAAARGVSERALQTFLGHADVRSTRRYARMADSALLDVLRPSRGAGREGAEKTASKSSGCWWRRRESNPRPHGVQTARLRA